MFYQKKKKKRKLIGKYYYRGKEKEKVDLMFTEELKNLKKLIKQAEYYPQKYNNVILITHACWFRVFYS